MPVRLTFGLLTCVVRSQPEQTESDGRSSNSAPRHLASTALRSLRRIRCVSAVEDAPRPSFRTSRSDHRLIAARFSRISDVMGPSSPDHLPADPTGVTTSNPLRCTFSPDNAVIPVGTLLSSTGTVSLAWVDLVGDGSSVGSKRYPDRTSGSNEEQSSYLGGESFQ